MSRSQPLRVVDDAVELCAQIYEVTAVFPTEEMYGLKAQMRRAAVSVASNLAEGSHRRSDRDFARFVAMAEGSLAEVAIQARLAVRLGFLEDRALRACRVQMTKLEYSLNRLRRRLESGTLAKQ